MGWNQSRCQRRAVSNSREDRDGAPSPLTGQEGTCVSGGLWAVHHSPGILAIQETQPSLSEGMEPLGHILYLKSCGLRLMFFLNSDLRGTHSIKDVFTISCK